MSEEKTILRESKQQRKEKIRTAVLGASGLVGQSFVLLLSDHPFFKPVFLSASPENAGKTFGQVCLLHHPSLPAGPGFRLPEEIRNLEFHPPDPELLEKAGVQAVFSSLPAALAQTVEKELRARGFAVFSNSSAHRHDPEIPVLIPEVNPEHLRLAEIQKKKHGGFIVAGSNCCVAGAALALKPLLAASRRLPSSIRINTYQSISGAGRRGLSAFDLAGNLIPYISGEEEKIQKEIPKIFGRLERAKIHPARMKIKAACVRVPVASGHLLHLEVEWREKISSARILRSLKTGSGLKRIPLPTAPSNPLILRTEDDRPQPALDLSPGEPARAAGMAITLGRIKLDENSVSLFLLVNNLVRGAAGNCLLAAELALISGLIG
ncbi:MAG: aspartate-semialdehyde dehydrogenase [Candidatus Saccharicenans sp.]